MRHLAALFPYFRRHPGKLTGGIAAILGAVAVGLAAPIVVGRAVDAFMASVSGIALLRYALLLVGITAVQGIFSFTQRMVLVSLSRDIEYELRNDYFVHLEKLSSFFFQHSRTGDLMARATNDLQAVRMVCGPAIMYSANTAFTAAGALYFMASIHWPLTLLALGTMPLVALVTQFFGQRIHTLFARVQEQFAELSNRVQENLAGVRVVRSYAIEESELESFLALNREYVQRNKVLVRWTAAFHPLLQLLVGVGFAAVLWYGGLQVWRGTISVGEFVSFNFFLSKLVWPMIAIGWVINLVQRGSASLRRILEVMASEPEIADRPPTLPPRSIRGEITFRRVTFSYADRDDPALEEVDFALGAGQTLGIVGRTGAGKSTLLSLLPRLIDPPPGTVFIDGLDAHRFALADLRSMMGFVPQETFLFSASVRENIAFGRTDATSHQVEEAARVAGLTSDLEVFPRGLETLVGERGVTLSGGQKQRVALARAVLRQPGILLLDDCLSAVDAATEEEILHNLRQVFVGRTVLVASHRISAVKEADFVLVLQQGRVVDRGRHEQLMAADGLYADLARRQRLEEELAAV
jgi:ATP-binding cassette subfamily B protein